MRVGNPALRRMVKKCERGEYGIVGEAATYKGVYVKAAIFCAVTLVVAVLMEALMFHFYYGGDMEAALLTIGIVGGVSLIPLLIVALVIAFVPRTVKVLGFVYTALQGASLGVFASLCDLLYPGIALAALLGTIVVFLTSLVVHSVVKNRIGSKFMRCLIIFTVSMLVVQLIMAVVSLFTPISYTAYLWIQLGVSALCIIWATVMLLFDFQNIEYIVQTGADKSLEWNAAFCLVSTLIYLYFEILELLLRIASLFSKNN